MIRSSLEAFKSHLFGFGFLIVFNSEILYSLSLYGFALKFQIASIRVWFLNLLEAYFWTGG